ncbi:MAG: DUF1080 domain-containing protein [Armatimonadota bacterium]|nr:DUF1080 domain-containing protein [Armatimonadota bacterium]
MFPSFHRASGMVPLGALTAALALVAFSAAGSPAERSVPPEPEGMVSLFNGKDLTGWEGDPRLWSVLNGAIRGETTPENPTRGNTFLIWKGGEVADFDLRLFVRIHHGNSGIQYRSRRVQENTRNAWIVAGYQAEVANEPGRAGFLYDERGRGRICLVGEKVVMTPDGKKEVVGRLGDTAAIAAAYRKAASEEDAPWNEYVIVARGNHLRHWVNGVQTVDLVDDHPQGRHMKGVIALQIHAGAPMWVEFKDIRLKQFPLP